MKTPLMTALATACVLIAPRAGADTPQEILGASGVQGGLIVHLGGEDEQATVALCVNERLLVHGLFRDARKVQQARRQIHARGLYGRVSVDVWNGASLPYADNLVNLVIAEDRLDLSAEEIQRVLCPGGTAYIKEGGEWSKSVKPRPQDMDEWTHFLHGPDNNAVAQDSYVGIPRFVQWIDEPKWDRHHDTLPNVSVALSAGGKLFTIVDEGPSQRHFATPQWSLMARDAFNGIVLWKRSIDKWENHLTYFRAAPAQLPRRMVVHNDRLYVTLGYGKPISVLDAESGETIDVFEGTEKVDELIYSDGILYAVARDEWVDVRSGNYSSGRWKLTPRIPSRLLAVNAQTGAILWENREGVASQALPLSLTVKGNNIFVKSAENMCCLEAATGRQRWVAACGEPMPGDTKRTRTPGRLAELPNAEFLPEVWAASTVVALDELVLCTDEKHQLHAFSSKDGQELWATPMRPGVFSPPDVFYVDGKIWADYTPLDPVTGKVAGANLASFGKGMAHHRCYRKKATNRYLIASEAGLEYCDFATGEVHPNYWLRSGCQHGVLPCNGLTYLTPHPCACYIRTKLNGLMALAAYVQDKVVPATPRLEHGPAFGSVQVAATGDDSQAWLAYRHDSRRSGATRTVVPSTGLAPLWTVNLGSTLTPLTVGGGKVFVAEKDRCTLHALDEQTGQSHWRFVAGGRIDSPPAICGGLAVFGSRDGWVYGIRIQDGSLVWRFRAAPNERLICAFGQLESTWPVYGSVLVLGKTAYFAAGYSSFSGGGVYLYGLDVETGKLLYENRFFGPVNDKNEPVLDAKNFSIEGVANDILVSDGRTIYLRDTATDLSCNRIDTAKIHLQAMGLSLLDDTWFHRAHWTLSDTMPHRPPRETVFGDLIAFSENRAYAFRSYGTGRTSDYDFSQGYTLTMSSLTNSSLPAVVAERRRNRSDPGSSWECTVDVIAKGMVLTGLSAGEDQSILFLAGPPNVTRPRAIADSLTGKLAGQLLAVAASDGKELARYRLGSIPVFDGLAAAHGKLFVSLRNGEIVCLGK